MTYVIAEPCLDSKERLCLEVCPVNCIHEVDRMLVIAPTECIDCGACESECPVQAIFHDDALPEEWHAFAQINAAWDEGAERVEQLLGERRALAADSVSHTTLCRLHSAHDRGAASNPDARRVGRVASTVDRRVAADAMCESPGARGEFSIGGVSVKDGHDHRLKSHTIHKWHVLIQSIAFMAPAGRDRGDDAGDRGRGGLWSSPGVLGGDDGVFVALLPLPWVDLSVLRGRTPPAA
jgi:ferredoxin